MARGMDSNHAAPAVAVTRPAAPRYAVSGLGPTNVTR